MKISLTATKNGASFHIEAEQGDTGDQIEILRNLRKAIAGESGTSERNQDEVFFFRPTKWPEAANA